MGSKGDASVKLEFFLLLNWIWHRDVHVTVTTVCDGVEGELGQVGA